MKKTLIALMALAGVAAAVEPAPYTGEALSTWLTSTAQTVTNNEKYVLTFTLGDWNTDNNSAGSFFKITNDLVIRHQVGRYVGLGTTTAGPDGDYTSRNEVGNSSIALDTVNSGSADYSGWFYDSGTDNTGISGLTFSIDSSSAGGTIITMSNGTRTIALQKDGHTGITNLDFVKDDMIVSSASVVWGDAANVITYTVPAPEPATATLSLLALAGLAARRRRR